MYVVDSIKKHCALAKVVCMIVVGVNNKYDVSDKITLLCGKARLDYVKESYVAKYDIDDAVNFICYLFEEHGDQGLNNIDGDFAVAYWHKERQEVVCITSSFTVFSLYYYYDGAIFSASNEIDQLFLDSRVLRQPNLHFIANINSRIRFNNRHNETYYANVNYVPGGRVFRFTKDAKMVHKYWQPDIKKRYSYKTEDEWSNAIADVFSEAVNCRIMGGCEHGILFSGGLDSSAMASVAEKTLLQQGKKLYAFSHVLPNDYVGKSWDEREYIELFRGKNIEINYLDRITNVTLDDLRNNVRDLCTSQSLANLLTQQKLIELVEQKNVTNLLIGTFSELGMSGYGHGYFTELLLTGRWWTLFWETRAVARRLHINWFRLFVSDVLRPFIPEAFFFIFSPKLRESTKLVKIPFKDSFLVQHEHLSTPKFGKMTAATNHRRYQVNSINQAMEINIGALLDSNKLNRSFPFLDRRVVEICLAAPGWMKVSNGFRRNIIRRSMRGIMPDKICSRLTKGEAVPCYPEQVLQYIPEFRQLIAEIPRDSYAAQVLDLDELSMICGDGSTDGIMISAENFTMVIPPAISLAYFLNSFK